MLMVYNDFKLPHGKLGLFRTHLKSVSKWAILRDYSKPLRKGIKKVNRKWVYHYHMTYLVGHFHAVKRSWENNPPRTSTITSSITSTSTRTNTSTSTSTSTGMSGTVNFECNPEVTGCQ